jgi:signal peptidase I
MEATSPPADVRPRSPQAASLLSDLTCGLGHIYCGHFAKGIIIYGFGLMLVAIWIMLIVLMKGRFLQAMLMGSIPAVALWVFARLDARRLAIRAPADYSLKEYNRWYVYAILGATFLPFAVCGALFIRATAYQAVRVTTDRMAPTVREGYRVMVNKTIYDVEPMRRGDVVIVRAPNRPHRKVVQRLVALPGDEVRGQGADLLVNGVRIVRPSADHTAPHPASPGDATGGLIVPDGHGFFANDNPAASVGRLELADLGAAPLSHVVGKVECVYWPRPARVR